MSKKEINPESVAETVGGYSHAVEVNNASRFLFISGQIPEDLDGSVPADFPAQCHLIWENIGRVLTSAGMSYDNLVKVTTYLTHVDQARQNSEIRRQYLGSLRPALSVMVATTLETKWLLEIEAIAAA